MIGKVALLFCAQALFAQVITSQCIGSAPWGATPWNAGYAEIPIAAAAFAPAASNGGGFQIYSASPLAVTGVSLTSENAYDGPISVCGNMPFLGAVALEGCLPNAGAGAITYACGNGDVAILSENINAGPYGYAPQAYEAGPGYGYGYNRGCGCGAF